MKVEIELTDAQLEAIAARAAELVRSSDERWLSQKELATHLGCSVRTILSYQRAGMPHLRHGARPVFKASECERWLDGRGKMAQPNGAAPLERPAPGPRRSELHGHQEP